MIKKRNKLLTFVSSTLLAISAIPLSSCVWFHKEESVKEYKKSYRMNEIRVAEQNTFRKLNNVAFPNGQDPVRSNISDLEKEAYANFSNKTYHAIVDTSKKDNMSYATVGLYSLLNEMVGASSRASLTEDLNALLGMDEESRETFYAKLMKANSFASEDSTIQLKNGAFFDNFLGYSQNYVDYLTRLYCEAYVLDYSTEAGKMVEWVNQAVNSDGFIDTNFLELTEDSELYLFTTLYFKNMWANKYLEKNNIEDNFYLNDGSVVKTTFMKHSYMTDSYYDYDKYISLTDYYKGGTASITYLIPKDSKDNIFELTKNVNIFEEDETKIVRDDNEYPETFMVNLTTPKFTLKTDLNFRSSLANLGFEDMFDSNIDSFSKAFDDPKLSQYNIYLSVIKQRNEVEFNEDGTIVKSVSMASMAKEYAMRIGNTLDVNLNQPFIYIIRDINGTPIFVGHVDNPKA